MQRRSEPQMVEDFIRSSTSPWPGSGTATCLRTVVLSPGRYAPSMVVSIVVLITGHSPYCNEPMCGGADFSLRGTSVPQSYFNTRPAEVGPRTEVCPTNSRRSD